MKHSTSYCMSCFFRPQYFAFRGGFYDLSLPSLHWRPSLGGRQGGGDQRQRSRPGHDRSNVTGRDHGHGQRTHHEVVPGDGGGSLSVGGEHIDGGLGVALPQAPGHEQGHRQDPWGLTSTLPPTYEAAAAVHRHRVQRVIDPEEHHQGGDGEVEERGDEGHQARRVGQVQVTAPAYSHLEEQNTTRHGMTRHVKLPATHHAGQGPVDGPEEAPAARHQPVGDQHRH